jgi:para-aminobenzoate synthetase
VSAHGYLTVGAGGAIVLDSDPVAEYDEMLLKACAPLRPLLADEPAFQPLGCPAGTAHRAISTVSRYTGPR